MNKNKTVYYAKLLQEHLWDKGGRLVTIDINI